jgi:hypothetical protein
MADNQDDKKVKDLLDAATRAELERWFNLPSFEQLADRGVQPEPPPEDPAAAAVRERRAAAIACVDPALLEAHRRRVEPPDDLIKFKAMIDVRVDPDIATIDLAMIERQHAVGEPREVERPQDLEDDLNDCTPQALLRDLHRAELTFDKVFEIVEGNAGQRFDIVRAVAEAMATRWTLPPFGPSPFHEGRALLLELRDDRHRPWTEIKLPNRRVTS